MDPRIEQLKAATAGRYRIFAEETEDYFDIICLDHAYNLVTNRRMTRAQLQNRALMTAVYRDLMMRLGCQ